MDAAIIAGAFTILAIGLVAVLGVETWLLATKRPPITTHTRLLVHRFPAVSFGIGVLLAVALGWLGGHLGR